MPIEEAKKLGAMALFGEKYGDVVRVVSAGDFSVEFCGGTHVANTSNIGLFKIRQEGSVAAGVRRIEALTGMGVLNYINKANQLIMSVAGALKITNPKMMLEAALKAEATIRAQQKEIDELNAKLAASKIDEYLKNSTDVCGVKVVTANVGDSGADALRTMCEKAKSIAPDTAIVLASVSDGKVTFAAGCGKQAISLGANAGKIVKAVAQAAGGNGGGKPDFAMAGAKEADKVSAALDSAVDAVRNLLS